MADPQVETHRLTWPQLSDLSIPTRQGLPLDPVLASAELKRRQMAVRKLVAFFRERPYQFVTMQELADRFGLGGFRTRVSEARRFVFEPEHGELKNERVRREDNPTYWASAYIYKPQRPLGRDASEYREVSLFDSAEAPFRR